MRAVIHALGIALGLSAMAAAACGYCVEDKIAAVYDHDVVTRALGRKHYVAFFAINGTLTPGDGARRAIEVIVESARGVDKGSAKLSTDSASLALAFDPQRTSLSAVQKAIEQKLVNKNLSLQPLRIIEQHGQMKVIDENR